MNTNMQRTVAGNFQGQDLGSGGLRFAAAAPGGALVQLVGAEPGAFERLRGAKVSEVGLDWHGEGVSVTLKSPSGPVSFKARAALVHEPLPRLYDGLPLVVFDAAARRFWRRVFLLVRIPGGRRLLGLVARRAGRSK